MAKRYRAFVCSDCGKINDLKEIDRTQEYEEECTRLRAELASTKKLLDDERSAHGACHALMSQMAETLRRADIDELIKIDPNSIN